MCQKFLIVEDRLLTAWSIEAAIMDLGFDVLGVAATSCHAMEFLGQADVALVDLDLLDGSTGSAVGRLLAAHGAQVVYMSADTGTINVDFRGVLGYIVKPIADADLLQVIAFAASVFDGVATAPPDALNRSTSTKPL
ncbi:response regulator [Rhizobium deserti]|uniref:Response regulator n=1 Tax=Rhizobium deserti TaxID=2547961 RepID=A0A4R5U6D9_9HYPH|nr:response regulator [Rhizobium deserti]TDK29678.1 response regulator [Rhizobium deserti]